jgi:hypothetical protein
MKFQDQDRQLASREVLEEKRTNRLSKRMFYCTLNLIDVKDLRLDYSAPETVDSKPFHCEFDVLRAGMK